MSENWAERQRRTNKLVRLIAAYLLEHGTVLPDQLYGLCKLTWITNSYSGQDAAYIRSTKVPALGQIFSTDYSQATLADVATKISGILGTESAKALVSSHTGFTNFYKAYRNSCGKWISSNFQLLLPLFELAYKLDSDSQGLMIIREIEKLPGIPKQNQNGQLMRPEYLLTPAFFALDHRLRFPLINGNKGVRKLLTKLKVIRAPLQEQYDRMISLYGTGGINDAADLDRAGLHLPDFVTLAGKKPTKKFLETKPTSGAELPLKDESDIESLQQAKTVTSKRLHNKLTNKLKMSMAEYTLLEGSNKSAMFDVLVQDYDGDRTDLLIEVKSSIEIAHIRMAVGQLFDYWFFIKGNAEPHIAILLPATPDDKSKQLLAWLEIGVLWFSDEELKTSSDWLRCLTTKVNQRVHSDARVVMC